MSAGEQDRDTDDVDNLYSTDYSSDSTESTDAQASSSGQLAKSLTQHQNEGTRKRKAQMEAQGRSRKLPFRGHFNADQRAPDSTLPPCSVPAEQENSEAFRGISSKGRQNEPNLAPTVAADPTDTGLSPPTSSYLDINGLEYKLTMAQDHCQNILFRFDPQLPPESAGRELLFQKVQIYYTGRQKLDEKLSVSIARSGLHRSMVEASAGRFPFLEIYTSWSFPASIVHSVQEVQDLSVPWVQISRELPGSQIGDRVIVVFEHWWLSDNTIASLVTFPPAPLMPYPDGEEGPKVLTSQVVFGGCNSIGQRLGQICLEQYELERNRQLEKTSQPKVAAGECVEKENEN